MLPMQLWKAPAPETTDGPNVADGWEIVLGSRECGVLDIWAS